MPLKDWDLASTWRDQYRSAITQYFDRYPSTRPHIEVGYMDFPFGWSWRGNPEWTERRFFGLAKDRAGNLIKTLNLAGKSVAVIGAGFGWTVEGLNERGISAVGTDTSAWILGELENTEEAEARAALDGAGITGAEQDTFEIQCSVPPSVSLPLPFALKSAHDPAQAAKGRVKWTVNALQFMQRSTWGRPGRGAVGKLLGEDGGSTNSKRSIANAVGGSIDVIITEYALSSLDDNEALSFCALLADLASRFGTAGVQVVHLEQPLDPDLNQDPGYNWKTLAGWRALLDGSGDAAIQAQEIRRDERSGAV